MLKLRPYQEEALRGINEAWQKRQFRPAVVLPTGMGKTVIFAHLAYEEVAFNEGRPLVLVHRDELVNQTVAKLHSVDPTATIGVIKGERNELNADYLVASVQTLSQRARLHKLSRWAVSLIIVDEAHHAAADSYLEILRYFGAFNDDPWAMGPRNDPLRVVGFSATLSRNDKRKLGDIWSTVAYKKDILYGIVNGFLCDVRAKSIQVEGLDLDDVKRTAGDYQASDLGDALIDANAPEIAATNWREYADGRPTVAFCPNVATAEEFHEAFTRHGISSAIITGSTPVTERAQYYQGVRDGDISVLINCMVLTEGFDMPQISCVLIARPTTSPALYTQMVGRGLRPWQGKTDCLILDMAGVTGRHRLASIADLSETEITPKDNESLTEAKEREERERLKLPEGVKLRHARIKVSDVDLFSASKNLWLRTKKQGYWFIPAGNWTVVMVPNDTTWETFDVWQVWTHYQDHHPSVCLAERVELGYGMAWAENAAIDLDSTLASRNAPWRKRKTEPSDAQLRYGTSLGIDVTGLSRAELSDQISIVKASRLFDSYVPEPPTE